MNSFEYRAQIVNTVVFFLIKAAEQMDEVQKLCVTRPSAMWGAGGWSY